MDKDLSMNESELHNLFGVAESRGMDPLAVVESLYINGRQIYLHFAEEQMGIMVFDVAEESEELIEYRISAGKVYPLTPDSRVELADALNKNLEKKELKIRVAWEDAKSKVLGHYYIKVTVDLKSELVVDYEDFRFIHPPSAYQTAPESMYPVPPEKKYFEKFEDIVIPRKRKPHTAYVVVAKTMMKIDRGAAWNELVNLSQKSKGQIEVELPGWGKIYLRRVRLNPEKEILYSHEQFDSDKTETLPDGVNIFNSTAFNTSWTDHK